LDLGARGGAFAAAPTGVGRGHRAPGGLSPPQRRRFSGFTYARDEAQVVAMGVWGGWKGALRVCFKLFFLLETFILMICDLSGKEERLCEHRTKIKRLIHCTSIGSVDFFNFYFYFCERLSKSGNRNGLSSGSFSPAVAPGSLLLHGAGSGSALTLARGWGGSCCRPSPRGGK